jgi:hypothetical protein
MLCVSSILSAFVVVVRGHVIVRIARMTKPIAHSALLFRFDPRAIESRHAPI